MVGPGHEVGARLVAALQDGSDDLVKVNIVKIQRLGWGCAGDCLPQLLQVNEMILQQLKSSDINLCRPSLPLDLVRYLLGLLGGDHDGPLQVGLLHILVAADEPEDPGGLAAEPLHHDTVHHSFADGEKDVLDVQLIFA